MLRVSSRRSSSQVGYRKLKGETVFGAASPSRGGISFDSSLYVSPESNPTVISERESPQKNIGLRDILSSPAAPFCTSASSIALFSYDTSFDSLDLSFDVDHVAELLSRSPLTSGAREAAISLFRDDLSLNASNATGISEKIKEPAAFTLSSAVTSPRNRVSIDEGYQMIPLTRVETEPIKDVTARIVNGLQQQAGEVPNFSVVVSPMSKEETHTFSVDGDWSFNKSASTESDESAKPFGTNLTFEPEEQWVEFDPFEEVGTQQTQQSFTPFMGESDASCDSLEVTHQLKVLSERLSIVEQILRNQYHGYGDDLSMGFCIDDDERTCTPVKSHESKSAVFGRFFSKKTSLCEI